MIRKVDELFSTNMQGENDEAIFQAIESGFSPVVKVKLPNFTFIIIIVMVIIVSIIVIIFIILFLWLLLLLFSTQFKQLLSL